MKKIILGLLMTFCMAGQAMQDDNLLLWWYDDPYITDIDGSQYTAGTLIGRGEAEGKTVNAVRISTVGSDGEILYLDLCADYGTATYIMVPAITDDGSSPDWYAGPAYADLSGLNLNDTGRRFMMEIGYAEFEKDELVRWTIMAVGSDSLQNLIDNQHIVAHELGYHGDFNWAPEMAVPEPNSGLLCLIGLAVLLLVRPCRCIGKNIYNY